MDGAEHRQQPKQQGQQQAIRQAALQLSLVGHQGDAHQQQR